MESLIDKLKSLGIKIGEENKKIIPIVRFPIDEVIDGEWIHDRFGDVFMTCNKFPYGYSQGSVQIKDNISPILLYEVSRIVDQPFDINDLVFIDIETSGLAGGTGTMVFLIGLGFFNDSGFVVNQYFLANPDQEFSLLTKTIAGISGHKIIVTYNGSSFDLPVLKSRFSLNRIGSPFKSTKHLDLLHLSRKLWKLRLGVCKLRDIELEILEFKRKEEEVPGWMVPQLYFDFLKNGDGRPLKGVFYHNCMDVLSLAAIFIYAADLLSQPIVDMNLQPLDVISMAKVFEKIGMLDKSSSLYQFCIQEDIPQALLPSTLLNFGNLYKKIGHADRAIRLWELSFENGNIYAAIEIAKYYEHLSKRYDLALQWVKQANAICEKQSTVGKRSDILKEDLYKREMRLLLKIERLNKSEEK